MKIYMTPNVGVTAPHVVASAHASIHTIHIITTQADLSIKEIKDVQFDRLPYQFHSRLHDAEYRDFSRERPARRIDASDEYVQFGIVNLTKFVENFLS